MVCSSDGVPYYFCCPPASTTSGEAKNKRYATEIIHECNEAWKKLIAGQADHTAAGVVM